MAHWKMPLSMQEKVKVWGWVSKMGLWQNWSRTQRSKKKCWGRWMKASVEAWGNYFLEKKWCDGGGNASERRKWIVAMEEKKQKTKKQRNGGQNLLCSFL